MLEELAEEFPKICDHLKLGQVELGRKNPSPAVLDRKDLSAAQIDLVKTRYAEDYAWMANLPRKL